MKSVKCKVRNGFSGRHFALFTLHFSLCTFFSGCESAPPANDSVVIQLPARGQDSALKVSDLATPVPPSANIVAAPLAPRRLIVQVLAFDRDSPRIPIARDMLDDGALAGAVGRLWRENGLVFASLDRSRLPLLMANLPKPLTGRIWTLYNAGVDNPVTLIEKPTGRLRVDVVEADGSIQPRRFIGGEHRLLVKIEPGAEPTTGPTHLALLPQHFSRGRVLVVTPEDRSKEGFSFDQLHVRHPIGESEVWLIMADPSPPSAIPLEPPKPEPRAVTKPITLGESMLTGDYRGKPVRLIVLIGLEEEHPAP